MLLGVFVTIVYAFILLVILRRKGKTIYCYFISALQQKQKIFVEIDPLNIYELWKFDTQNRVKKLLIQVN